MSTPELSLRGGVAEQLRHWADQLNRAEVPSPDHDARVLAAHVLGVNPAELVLVTTIDPASAARISELVARRQRREPLQHILGEVSFLDVTLAVGPGVFVPRPETEVMADWVIRTWQQDRVAERVDWPRRDRGAEVLVDLCTGSGVLALAIAAQVPYTAAVAVENSESALSYARQNLERNGELLAAASSSCRVVEADARQFLAGEPELAGRAAVVVTNPPYIPDAMVPVDPEVAEYDPRTALYGGADGLDVVRDLVDQARQLLRPGGLVVIEHADVQGESAGPAGVPTLLRAAGFATVLDHPDLTGRPRFTSARLPAKRR